MNRLLCCLAALVLSLWGAAVLAESPTPATTPVPANAQPITCKGDVQACIQSILAAHPIRNPAYWNVWRARPLDERIAPGPPEVVSYLRLDVIANRIPLTPSTAQADDEMLDELRQAVKDLPANIRKLLERRLLGVFLVKDFGGTGLTEAIRWGQRDGVGFMVLDPDVLRSRVANQWASWKENSPFRDDGDWRIEAVIAKDGDNLRQRAVQYILLHEIAHVLATRDTVHPYWSGPPVEVETGRYPFFDLSWHWDASEKKHAVRVGDPWPGLKKLRYYFGAQLGGAESVAAYRWLATTNFPSLYAATSPGDDFAESFVTYVHVVLQKRPWEIRILQGENLVLKLDSCWDQPRCAEKRKLLEALLIDFERDAASVSTAK